MERQNDVRAAIDSALWDGVNCWSDGERENDPDAFERELEACGYVIVPKEPTPEMRGQMMASLAITLNTTFALNIVVKMVVDAWGAAIAARPRVGGGE